jgi:hypothetical protein
MSQSKAQTKPKGDKSSKLQGKQPRQRPNPAKTKLKRGALTALSQASGADYQERRGADVNADYLKVAQQILGPAICPDQIVATPNACRRYVVPRRYRRVVDFTVPLSGKFTVAMYPNLFAPGYLSDGAVHTIPAVAGPLNFQGVSLSSDVGSRLNSDGKMYIGDSSLLVKATDITDGAAVEKHGYLVTSTGNTYVAIRNVSDAYQNVEIWNRVIASGNWSLANTLRVAPQATASLSYSTPSDAVGFALAAGSSKVGDKDIAISIQFTNGIYTSVAGTSFAPAFGKQINDLGITDGRVISMSMKITNTSAAILKAGNISIGRVPSGFNAFGDISINMSKLPPNRVYQDVAETGGYAFWMPEQSDEWDFDSISKKTAAYNDANYLVAHLNALPPDAAFKITFGWVVEFYTDNQNFPKVPTPIDTPYWREVQGMLILMDAACCNPESADMFRRFLSSGMSTLTQVRDHYSRNKETYDMLLALAKRIAALAL